MLVLKEEEGFRLVYMLPGFTFYTHLKIETLAFQSVAQHYSLPPSNKSLLFYVRSLGITVVQNDVYEVRFWIES